MATIKVAKDNQVKCLFLQKEFANRNTRIVARETGATVITINPLSYNWEDVMLLTAKRLK